MTGNPEVGLLERHGLHGLLLPNAAVFTDRILAYVNIRQLSASRESLRRIAFMRSCILVALILVLFLFEWRTAVISLTTIPLSLMTAALVLHWRGATLNTMVIAGLAIALGEVVYTLPIYGKLGVGMTTQPSSVRIYCGVLVSTTIATSSVGVRRPLNRSALSIRFEINSLPLVPLSSFNA